MNVRGSQYNLTLPGKHGGQQRRWLVSESGLPYSEAKRIGLQLDASRAYGVSIVSESGLYRPSGGR